MKSLAEQLATQVGTKPQDFKPTNSKPRCVCHNKYVDQCLTVLKDKPWDCVCGMKDNSPGRTRCRRCGRDRKG